MCWFNIDGERAHGRQNPPRSSLPETIDCEIRSAIQEPAPSLAQCQLPDGRPPGN